MGETLNRGKYTTPDGSATWEYVSAVCGALLFFCIGCAYSWTSPSLVLLIGPDSPIPLTSEDASTLASMITVGNLIAPSSILLLNRFGRKTSLYGFGVLMIIGNGLVIAAKDTSVLFLARFIIGFASTVGVCFVVMYLGEISSVRLRGSFGIACAAMMNTGVIFMMVMVPRLSVRMMAYVTLTIVTISTVFIWFIPESPYFLAINGKFDEAEEALEKLRGKTDVAEELNLIKETVRRKEKVSMDGSKEEGKQENRERFSALKQLFTISGNRKALIINLLFLVIIQAGGYGTIMMYGHLIFDAMKSGISSNICMTVAGVLKMTCNIAAGFFVDKFGRRPIIINCGFITVICLFIVSAYFIMMDYTDFDVTPYKLVAPFSLLAMIVAVNIGILPLMLVIQSETLDAEIKALANFLMGTCVGGASCLSVKFYMFTAVIWDLGHGVPFFMLFAFTGLSLIIIIKLLPETKGKTLLQIQKDLNA